MTQTTLKLQRQGFDNLVDRGLSEDDAFLKSTLFIIKDGDTKQLDTLVVDKEAYLAEFAYYKTDDDDEEPYRFFLAKDQLEQLDVFNVRASWFGKDDVELFLFAEPDVTFRRADIKKVKE